VFATSEPIVGFSQLFMNIMLLEVTQPADVSVSSSVIPAWQPCELIMWSSSNVAVGSWIIDGWKHKYFKKINFRWWRLVKK
jgi:hypothetical protein